MTRELWRIEQLTVTTAGRRRLTDVNCTIDAGVTAVIGGSGAGKSTLLNILVDFELPSHGRVHYAGSIPADRPSIFWGPTDGSLWPHLSVREHLASVAPRPAADSTDRLLDGFLLSHLSDRRVTTLSAGERSRLIVARGAAARPAVLVLDEPFAHVDPGSIAPLWNALREELSRDDASLVFSSHRADVVLREADAMLVLEKGSLAATGSTQAIYRDPPNSSIAALLGPANWFDEPLVDLWQHAPPPTRCIRPEELVVVPAARANWEVVASRDVGPWREVALNDATATTDERRRAVTVLANSPATAIGERIQLAWRPSVAASSSTFAP